VIQLYAITDHPSPPLPAGVPLGLAVGRDLAAVWAPAPEGEVTAEMLWRHERVVEELMDDRDLLPVRYGTRLPDEAAAAKALEADHDQLAASLQNVRGAVELSVRALSAQKPRVTRSPAPVAASGTEYLQTRAREAGARDVVARSVHDPLAAVARAHNLRPPSLPGEQLRAAYLVDRGKVESFSALVAELQEGNPSLRLICTGPWPPYSFAQP
jgi:Gas vesicle synthesis protein GvpL/GvpF